MQNINIRLERPEDYRAVEELTRDAFWDYGDPKCTDHLLVHKLRKLPEFLPKLDYVAEIGGKLAGSVLYSRAKIVADDGAETEIVTFGPLSVLPEYKFTGVGRALMEFTIAEAKRLGYRGIVFFGHPDYYPKLGFRRAYEFGIYPKWGAEDFDPLMAMELYDGAFDGVRGKFHESKAFYDLPADELAEFEKTFPPKAPPKREPIEVLLERLEPEVRAALETQNYKILADMHVVSERKLLQLPGIDTKAIETIKAVMRENNRRWGT